MGRTVLIVDDEVDILNLVSYNLKREGYNVISAEDGPLALALSKEKKPDLVILDIMLPDMDGVEVLKNLKREDSTSAIPVIMLTAKGEEIDRIVGLELGADDYITKPFSPRELILRVKAILKRKIEAPFQGEKVFSYRELSLDALRHKVIVNKTQVKLTKVEFKLLQALLSSRGRVFSRDALLDKAWGMECYVTERTVDTHIRRLRVKLKSSGKYIETVRGVGYRFGGE